MRVLDAPPTLFFLFLYIPFVLFCCCWPLLSDYRCEHTHTLSIPPSLFLLCYYTQQPASSLSLPSPYIPMIDSYIISALLGFFFERTHMSRLGPCLRAQARLLRCLLDVVWSVRTRVRIICERWCSNQDMGKNTTQEGVWQPVWQVLALKNTS
jgi:hypothetical protein